MTIDPFVEAFLKSPLYVKLFKKNWQLVHTSIMNEFALRDKKPSYIPRGAKGFIKVNKDTLEVEE